MMIRDRLSALLGVMLLLGITVLWMNPAQSGSKKNDRDDDRGASGFSEESLSGSYASSGFADGYQSRSVGVFEFDGRGSLVKLVLVNANDGSGGRRLIEVASTGTYTVNASGTGVMNITDVTSTGSTNHVTYDFVINTNTEESSRGGLIAQEITCLQREAGATASLVEHILTRRDL